MSIVFVCHDSCPLASAIAKIGFEKIIDPHTNEEIKDAVIVLSANFDEQVEAAMKESK